ncbi:hypothetical protein D3C81_1531470 [compost metagenome]
MTDLPGWNNVLPLNAGGTFGVFAWYIPAGLKIHPIAGVLAATVELGGLRGIKFPGDFLRFVESARGIGLSPHGEKQKQQSKTTDTH